MKKWKILLCLIIALNWSCGHGGSQGGGNTVPPSPSPIYLSINFPIDGSLIGGGTKISTVEGTVSYCSSNDKIQLLIDNQPVAITDCRVNYSIDFDSANLTPGIHTLTVQLQLQNVSTNITVKVDPAELRREAKQFLINFNTLGVHPGVRRWASIPITIEVSSEIVKDGWLPVYQEAADFWTKYTGITFRVIPSTESNVNPMTGKYGVVFFEYGTPLYGSDASTWNNVDLTYTHIASIVTIKKEFGGEKDLVAHEIGHTLGIWAEINDGTITDHYTHRWRMNAVTAEALKILYFELHPGDKISTL